MIRNEIKIGKLTAGNRLVMPPMATAKTEAGHVTDELVEYYRDRAVYSHPGIVITEHSCIAPDGRAHASMMLICDDGMIEEHRRLTDAIHEGGCLAFVQVNHAGSNGMDEPVSASDVPLPLKPDNKPPRPLTAEEIRAMEKVYAAAAVRAVKAGYDGVEIHCAHGYLLNQFYSPLTNKRTDAYGGELENRMRFLLETVAAVREAIGPDVPLAVRLGGADYLPGGSTEEDAVEAAKLLEKAGVDLLDLSGGMCFYTRPDHKEPGYFSSMTEKIKKAVSVPVMLTGGVRTLADAERLLQEGKADLIGVGRSLLKDAHWLEKQSISD